jgi:hypothetical protein
MRGMRNKGFTSERNYKAAQHQQQQNGGPSYGSRPDSTVTLKGGYVYVLTKKNKGTVVGVYTTRDRAEVDKEELGGERYFRISNYFIDAMIYK